MRTKRYIQGLPNSDKINIVKEPLCSKAFEIRLS